MNLHEFLQSLRTIKDKFEWVVEGRCYLRAHSADGICFCPLTALYFECTKMYVSVDHVDIAWKWLEINVRDAEVIVAAADLDTAWRNPDEAIKLRKQIKEILGFE
jgi:hypothetical protein